MKKIIEMQLFGLAISSLLLVQCNRKAVSSLSTQETPEKITHIDIPVMIPFTQNAIVNQYMADYRSLLNLYKFVYDNHLEKQTNVKLVEEYSKFNNKYSLIQKEINTLSSDEKAVVSQFVNEKNILFKNLVINSK